MGWRRDDRRVSSLTGDLGDKSKLTVDLGDDGKVDVVEEVKRVCAFWPEQEQVGACQLTAPGRDQHNFSQGSCRLT